MTKYYKTNKGIRAIHNGQEFLIESDWIELSDEQLKAELAPSQEELNQMRVSEIDARLKAIDLESLRPFRAISEGTATDFDHSKLKSLGEESISLRAERAQLVTA